jgi:hypothetical protein
LNPRAPIKVDLYEMAVIAQKFENLLAVHTIARLSGNPLVCTLRTIELQGAANVKILGR